MHDILPTPDLDRRFGGLARLYGPDAPARLSAAHVAVVGLGGVGSWTVEALARSGVGALTLIDLDHIAESNINRQLHALTGTLGQSKVEAMAERVLQINPACKLIQVDDFVVPENVAAVLPGPYAAIIDCTDQASAKVAMVLHARTLRIPLVLCGGAGGKTDVLALRAGDLAEAVNDALLAKLRYTLRREHGYPKATDAQGRARQRLPKMRVNALWFDQPAILPATGTQTRVVAAGDRIDIGTASRGAVAQPSGPQGLSCAGYGSVVTVTAAMGMAAAQRATTFILQHDLKLAPPATIPLPV